jgi:two-component system, NtrC family, sensor kinase
VLRKDGDFLRFRAHHGPIALTLEKWPINRDWVCGRTFVDRKPVSVADLSVDEEFPDGREMALDMGHRGILAVPLLREDEAIGVIVVRRIEVNPFSDKQTKLLQTFADQAVIAIENVRLFDEVQARTRDLTESLQQQTATADVLKVISRSTFDLESVMSTLARSALELCGADNSTLWEREGDFLVLRGSAALEDRFVEFQRNNPIELSRDSYIGRAALDGAIANVADFKRDTFSKIRKFHEVMGFRSLLAVPLTRNGEGIGAFVLTRQAIGEFAPRQVELVQTFADQAVIAIENVRLFDEVQARTRDLTESLQQQTATADVLKVISRSAFDLKTVLHTLVESAAKLADADRGTITREENGVFYRAEFYGFPNEFMEAARRVPVLPDRSSVASRALLEGKVVHISDVLGDTEDTFAKTVGLDHFRTALGVPMLREGTPIGVLTLTRTEQRPFTQKQIELVSTFADQAAIAIENSRLFEEVQSRTQELSRSLQDLQTAQDRLVQTEKLASLGQLTAGIAHEIKNPLNFVNNFSTLSTELIDELKELLDKVPIDAKAREEFDDITGTLKGNLDKVVQHGKRADSIVKNMLLHSRQGSGEHRPVDVNAVVEESLNLAYHGARAANSTFNIDLQRDFDPDAGIVDGFPQEISRVLLNLISNGFYAATKRKDGADAAFAPTIRATTKAKGAAVEIRIRDNGTGIPPEVKEKIFNPFFTTKPAGEGTGLGLSMSHDIVVKQHGGTLAVDTVPGQFTEFVITLPRKAAAQTAPGKRQ